MVTRGYLLSQPPKRSELRLRWDQQAIPALIDAAGTVEVGLEKVAATVRRVPVTCVLIATGVGFLAAQAGRTR